MEFRNQEDVLTELPSLRPTDEREEPSASGGWRTRGSGVRVRGLAVHDRFVRRNPLRVVLRAPLFNKRCDVQVGERSGGVEPAVMDTIRRYLLDCGHAASQT
ncbi:hypothetical protein [Streptomyces sp. HM190]|uniref:hypothetical protein n=1 Tax=Streptomyces sp. HM190 TaxID=2695266 RepID=UPI00135A5FDC|nr:hypothetical protein [Streptomyces sp. HM190]